MSHTQGLLASRLRNLIPDGSQLDVAKEAGLSRYHLNRLLNGKATNPKKSTLERLASVLDVPLDYLCDVTRVINMSDDLTSKSPVKHDSDTALPGLIVYEMGADFLADPGNRTQPHFVTLNGRRYVPVPHLRDPISTGCGLLDVGAIDDVHLVPESWLRNFVHGQLRAGRIAVAEVSEGRLGEGMAPTIYPGASLWLDLGVEPTGLNRIDPGSVYIVQIGDTRLCRRIWPVDHGLHCCADDPTIQPIVLQLRKGQTAIDVCLAKVISINNPSR